MRKFGVIWLALVVAGCGKNGGGFFGGNPDQNQPVSYWIEQLKSKDVERQKLAMRILVENGKKEKAVVDELVEKLENTDDEHRKLICQVLGRIGWDAEPEAIGPLRKLLRYPNTEVSNAAAEALWKINKEIAEQEGVVGSMFEKKRR